ncbi:unnamed protein product [Allacma fusca]|uniref:Uncharacterized protein n=1 Tax=Allacma fusca TaxID=39272 RepID=A0A8J2JL57_9HEXA|nr:unnamed protein product [Allacma fusca]
MDNHNSLEFVPIECEAKGDGLTGGPVGLESKFLVKTSVYKNKVSKSGLLVAFDGPSEPEIEFDIQQNGDTEVAYIPKLPGIYVLNVTYSDVPVKGNPFKVHVSGRGAPITRPNVVKRNIVKKVKISGEGLTEGKVNTPNEILLDISRAEINCELDVTVLTSPKPIISVVEKKPGLISLGYTPLAKGPLQMTLKFRGENVPGSPVKKWRSQSSSFPGRYSTDS